MINVSDLTTLSYLSFDSIIDGVGASQVLPYVERLTERGLQITLYSFETIPKHPPLAARLGNSGITWRPQRFGGAGPAAGLHRVLRGAALIRGAPLVHARSDLAAASALLARCRRWVWDTRTFWTDQRIDMGLITPGSVSERTMRRVEKAAATKSYGIIALSHAAALTLESRFGAPISHKVRVIPTCVDLDRFRPASLPARAPTRILMSGSFNRYYDVPTMLRLVECLKRRRPTELTVLGPRSVPWHAELSRAAGRPAFSVPHAAMPKHIQSHHVGLSVARRDVGVSARAAVPTKLAEFLACGRPIVVSQGLGDMDGLLARFRCGVILKDTSLPSLERGVTELEVLLDDPGTAHRCHALARAHFNLDDGAARLLMTYAGVKEGR